MADRLFKVRQCMYLQGIVRPLALFDLPIDPELLVKAAAAGLDVSGIIAGLNQPVSPMRCQLLIQKALELCGEVRGLGDAERLTTRKSALERLRFYQRALGLPADPGVADTITLDRRELKESNFDSAYAALVGQCDRVMSLQDLPALNLAGQSPSSQSGASGQGSLRLVATEDDELNQRLPAARDERNAAELDRVASVLAIIPDVGLDFHFWGLGGHLDVIGALSCRRPAATWPTSTAPARPENRIRPVSRRAPPRMSAGCTTGSCNTTWPPTS